MATPATTHPESTAASGFLYGLTGWLIAIIPAALFIYFASLIGSVAHGEFVHVSYDWIPSLDISLSFYIDGLGLLFALIITGIGTFIMIYAGGYLADDPFLGRFYIYILAFMVSMLGVVLSDNIISLFVFWELTSITSYMLIGYKHAYEDSRESARMAFLVTGSGGLAMLAGLLMLGGAAESWHLSEMLKQKVSVINDELYVAMFILVALGAFTKSAQFPFHFWLPGAMAAPTPVSAYLHSATMVKAGVYLLARLNPIMGGSALWFYTLGGFGAFTMLMGAYVAWQHTDLKRILAYSTVSALGTLVMLIGIGSSLAIKGAMIYLLVHSLYKGGLFMIAGSIDHETGTRDIGDLGGLRSAMPITWVATILAILSLSGIPPFYGFLGKEVIYDATLHASTGMIFFTTIAVLGNALTILAGGIVLLVPFFGKEGHPPKHPHEAPLSMWLGPVVLGCLSFFLGILVPLTEHLGPMVPLAPHFVAEQMVAPSVTSILNKSYEIELALWHGINTPFILSIITVALGVGGYFGRGAMRSVTQYLDVIPATIGPERLYFRSLDGLLWVANWQTRVLQNGYLRYYLLIIMATTSLLIVIPLTRLVSLDHLLRLPQARFYEYLLAFIILGAAFTAVHARGRLSAVLALGVVGYSVGLVFVLFGAPDLAMTQFSIETLMALLLVLVLYRLPRYNAITRNIDRIRDATVALISGGLMTILVLAVTNLTAESRLTPYFAENSYVLAKGQNIVNVILVDFRGVDTMGEITVLGVAAIGVYALMKLRLGQEQTDLPEAGQFYPEEH